MLETMPKTRAVVVTELPTRNRSSSRSYQLIVHDCPNLTTALAAGKTAVSFSTIADPDHFVARLEVQEAVSDGGTLLHGECLGDRDGQGIEARFGRDGLLISLTIAAPPPVQV